MCLDREEENNERVEMAEMVELGNADPEQGKLNFDLYFHISTKSVNSSFVAE